jgi:hypothetical protein
MSRENLRVENAVIDGEIACVDDLGQSEECLFFAFDLLYLLGGSPDVTVSRTERPSEETSAPQTLAYALR